LRDHSSGILCNASGKKINRVWPRVTESTGLVLNIGPPRIKTTEYSNLNAIYELLQLLQILVNRKDGGNLMNDNSTDKILKMERFIANNITINDGYNSFTYRNICGVYCNDSNEVVLTFIKIAINMNGRSSSSIAFTFPKARIFEKYIFMGYSVGDLHYSEQDTTVVDGFKLFILHFMVDLNLPQGKRITKNFESQLRTLLMLATYESEDLEYALFSRDREIEEQQQITLAALPFLGVTALMLVAFMVISLTDFPFRNSQHIE
ncbi:hypothetical protein WUBG_09284, partial [Wuchereria bancrofti]